MNQVILSGAVISVDYAFNRTENLKEITYQGIAENYNNITLGEGCKDYCPLRTIYCQMIM